MKSLGSSIRVETVNKYYREGKFARKQRLAKKTVQGGTSDSTFKLLVDESRQLKIQSSHCDSTATNNEHSIKKDVKN